MYAGQVNISLYWMCRWQCSERLYCLWKISSCNCCGSTDYSTGRNQRFRVPFLLVTSLTSSYVIFVVLCVCFFSSKEQLCFSC